MVQQPFDREAAADKILAQEQRRKTAREELRLEELAKCRLVLHDRFSGSGVEVFLVGSVTRPYEFRADSDLDIVLKGFQGDRFDIWTELEGKLQRRVEIILFESCSFQDFVVSHGLKVV